MMDEKQIKNEKMVYCPRCSNGVFVDANEINRYWR